ncbi:CTK1 [Candida theae]|uniref:cyclin-dependent kinase n=1 Tax=Candida theae TaxID=1198502 RepID=A0AAD5FWU7_9ASCO|nr:CTK1 [Candida theae]KAI5949452.1 CTK1 [Candida theae]
MSNRPTGPRNRIQPPSGPSRSRHQGYRGGRDEYRPSYRNGPPTGPRSQQQLQQQQQQQQRSTPPPPSAPLAPASSSLSKPPVRPSGPASSSYRSSSPSAPGGIKRPLPSGPSSFKKRRDFNSINSNRSNSKRSSYVPSAVKKEAEPALSRDQIYSIKESRGSAIYGRVQQVGEGTYGKVYKAKHSITNECVAVKKLRLESEREGFPITAIREIKLLQSFDHPNIVGLLEMMVEHNQIYMVFDYMDHDLTGLLTHPELELQECHRKFIFKQLMEGLDYLHEKRIIHRDIKGSNILLDNLGNLKIADFGLARTMKILGEGEVADFTNRVITIWYRPPELLLGATDYGREVDIWGVGCLLIELYTKMAAFRGMDEISQLSKIFNILGTPTLESWPQIDKLPWFEILKPKINIASKFEQKYSDVMTVEAFKLAEKLLALNPKGRPAAHEALQDEYFTKDPLPEPLTFLKDLKGEWHEFETKKRRREERKRVKEEEDAEYAASKSKANGRDGEKEREKDKGSTRANSVGDTAESVAHETGSEKVSPDLYTGGLSGKS